MDIHVLNFAGARYRGILYWKRSINISVFDLHLAYTPKYLMNRSEEAFSMIGKAMKAESAKAVQGCPWPRKRLNVGIRIIAEKI
jgi:hypothetical protein